MKLTIKTMAAFECELEVGEDLPLEAFKAVCEVESGIPAAEIVIVLKGSPLTDDSQKSLKEHNIKDGDLVVIQHIHNPTFLQELPNASNSSSPSTESSDDEELEIENLPQVLWNVLRSDPEKLSYSKQNHPELAEAFLSGNFEKFSEVVTETDNEIKRTEMLKQRLIENEFDPEAQKQLEEEILQKNIDDNLDAALEFNPESFGIVTMLYIDCKVNGHLVKAFVDSGCQDTVMSEDCAKRCNLVHLIDSRFSGVAVGVGTQPIVGRVHLSQIQIGDVFLASSFSILKDQKIDMLLGLDLLLRHNCTIDLERKVLVIGTTKTETRFLSEAELPDYARLTATSSSGNGKADAENVLDQSNNKRGAPSIDSAINKKQRKN